MTNEVSSLRAEIQNQNLVSDQVYFHIICLHGINAWWHQLTVFDTRQWIRTLPKLSTFETNSFWYHHFVAGFHVSVSKPCSSNPCLNDGYCVGAYAPQQVDPQQLASQVSGQMLNHMMNYYCVCKPLFKGTHCESK